VKNLSVSFGLDVEVMRSFPEIQVRFIAARGLRNGEPWDNVVSLISALETQAGTGEWQPFDDTHPKVSSWLDAYRRFSVNPRNFQPSFAALSRSLRHNGRLPRVNPAVDAYNFISVVYGIPTRAFDMEGLSGEVSIRFSRSGDSFTPPERPSVVDELIRGEIVYAEGSQILARSWDYRDSDISKVTPESHEVVFILERISYAAVPSVEMEKAQADLANLIRTHADQVVLAVIEPETPVTNLVEGEPGLIIRGLP
jgi:DNA/RNA-binding domain of Phe-tRNA-synthetase-like protein